MFATGEPRSGTTLLHALLAEDPDARALRFWEVMYPSPPPGPVAPGRPASGPGRCRLARHPRAHPAVARQPPVQRPARRWAPRVRAHLGVRLPEHDAQRLVARADDDASGAAAGPGRAVPDPPHGAAADAVRPAPSGAGSSRASTVDASRALFDTYPDACLIWVHRDPVQVIASQITAFGQINECLAGSLDWDAYARDAARVVAAELPRPPRGPAASTTRASTTCATATSCGLRWRRSRGLLRPVRPTLHARGARAAMRGYLANNRGDRHGRFVYSTDVLPGGRRVPAPRVRAVPGAVRHRDRNAGAEGWRSATATTTRRCGTPGTTSATA